MSITSVESVEQTCEDVMRCPTCRAQQPWSDECRRCKCELTLVRVAWRASRQARTRSLLHLREGRYSQALHQARLYRRLCGNEEARQMLAVCCVLAGQWNEALKVAWQL